MDEATVSESEERLAALIAVLGIERLGPVLDRMEPQEAFLIRQLARKKVDWKVLEEARTELAGRFEQRRQAERFSRSEEFWA